MAELNDYFTGLVSQLGTTEIWTAAGFILPDGSLLDFSDASVYEDTTCCAYTHEDLETFFGYSSDEVMDNGGIRIGYSDATDHPYIQMVLINHLPTQEQWQKINELLQTDPYTVDVEANKTLDISTSFYKRYTSENTSTDIQRDLERYLEGDNTYLGTFSEKLGIPDPKDN